MSEKRQKCSRRDFLKLTAVTEIGSAIGVFGSVAESKEAGLKQVPTRPFGKTGEQVSILSFGGSQNLSSKQLLLRQAFKMGVTYWDTAESYSGGKSEEAMGQYFTKYPEDRKKIFLVSKAHTSEPDQLSLSLNRSLERFKSDYVDPGQMVCTLVVEHRWRK